MRSRTDIGINKSLFLFVLDVIVLNFLDEGRRTYLLCRICVWSLIICIGFTQYLPFIQSSETGLFETGYFTTNIYNALQIILVFLTDVHKPTHKRTFHNTLDRRYIKRGQNGAINVKRTRFSEAVKALLTFLICDSAVAVPLQPIINCCAVVLMLVNYLYLVIVDDSVRQGWRVFLKINAHVFSFCCVRIQIRSITPCNTVV